MADSFDWGGALGGLAQLGGAALANSQNQRSIDKAVGIQRDSTQQAQQYLQDQQARANSMMAPYQALGGYATTKLLNGDVMNEPGYQFAQSEGEKSINRAAAARGGFGSGKRLKDLIRFNQDNATRGYNNSYNRLAGMANLGLGSTNSLISNGSNVANGLGNLATSFGNAAGAGAIQGGNSSSNLMGTGLSLLGNFLGSKGSNGQTNGQNALDGIGSLWNSMFGSGGGASSYQQGSVGDPSIWEGTGGYQGYGTGNVEYNPSDWNEGQSYDAANTGYSGNWNWVA